jgi:hypothetical protein
VCREVPRHGFNEDAVSEEVGEELAAGKGSSSIGRWSVAEGVVLRADFDGGLFPVGWLGVSV